MRGIKIVSPRQISMICFLLLCSLLKAQIDTLKISGIVQESFQKSPVKGLAVSIVDKHNVLLAKTFGKNLGKPIKGNTPLWLGSVSKTMTALGICRLADMGKLKLDDAINKYLDVDEQITHDQTITIKDLLHHYSGLSQESGYSKSLEYDGEFSKIKPSIKSGEKGIYSSANYALLGSIIENSSGKNYAQFMKVEVFQPLGMTNTFVPDVEEGSSMRGYVLAFGMTMETRQMKYGKHIVPAGYIVTTLDDVNKYSQFLLGNGSIQKNGTREDYLKSETFNSIFTPYQKAEYGYGKSWGIGETAGVRTYSHEGMTKISNAQITILPERGIAISVITNTNSGPFYSIASQATENIIATLNEEEPKGSFWGEFLVRISIGLVFLKMLYDTITYIRRWFKQGFPTKIKFKSNMLFKYIFDIIPLFVLLFLPKLINVPISMLLRIMPDIGIAILAGGLVSISHVFFKLVLSDIKKKRNEKVMYNCPYLQDEF